MKSKGAILWIGIVAVCFFFLGFMTNHFVARGGGDEPTYLDRLVQDLDLSDDQTRMIGEVLDEEDSQIQQIVDSARKPLLNDIQQIRDAAREKIRNLLDEPQRRAFDSGFPRGLEGGSK